MSDGSRLRDLIGQCARYIEYEHGPGVELVAEDAPDLGNEYIFKNELLALLPASASPSLTSGKHTAQCIEIGLMLGQAGFPEDEPIQNVVRQLLQERASASAPPEKDLMLKAKLVGDTEKRYSQMDLDCETKPLHGEIERLQHVVASQREWTDVLVEALGLERREKAVVSASALSPEPAWQPIETAPKDSSWCLGWNSDCGCFVWRDGPGLMTGEDPAPTHWLPLPAAPVATLSRVMSEADYGEMQPVADELLRRMKAQIDGQLPDKTDPEFDRLKAQKDAIVARETKPIPALSPSSSPSAQEKK